MPRVRIAALRPEPLLAFALSLAVGMTAVVTAGMDTKYKMAAILALGGSAVLTALPERRIACVVLWVLIHPLSIERVFPVDASVGQHFLNPTIVVNASDGPLALLVVYLLAETMTTRRVAFVWSRLTTALLIFLIWSGISYAIHATYLGDGFTTSSPLTLMQDVRLMIFVMLIQSAVRTRGEVILVLLAMALAIVLQTALVVLTYTTGHIFNYAAASIGSDTTSGLQTFGTSAGTEVVRAVGSLGITNEQAMFHTFMTIPLIAFLVARSNMTRMAGLGVIAGSALALILTFSRGAWLAFPFGLAVCGIIAIRRGMMGRRSLLIGTGLAFCGAVMLVFLAQPIYQRLAYGDSGATASRLRMLRLAGDLFQTDPVLGVGPGEFAEAALRLYPPRYDTSKEILPGEILPYPPPTIGRLDIDQGLLNGVYVRLPLPVHNKYMLALAELGVPGLIIWLGFYAAFIGGAWRCAKAEDLLMQVVGISGVGVAASELLYMMLDLFDQDKPLEIMLFIPALIVAASRCPATPRRPLPPAAA